MATQTIDIVARDKTKGVLGGIERSLGKIGALAAGAFGISALTNYANSVQTITNRLKLVTNGQKELNSTFKELTNVANRSRQDLDAVTDLYQKIALSTKDLGLNQAQVSRTTETFSKLLSIAGANTQSASGAIRQFAQALGSGAFRGDEFNSVVEAAPQILDILAKETGKARGEIRALAGDGKLTADVLINALLKASKDVDAQFAKTGPTIGQSFTVLKNNFLALGTTASPIFDALAKGILLIANNLETAIVFATSFGAALAVGKVVAMTRAAGGLATAIRAITAAMAANPIGLIAVVAATAITAIYNLIKPIIELKGELGVKLLYALEKAANGFINFFDGVGRAAFEFGKLLVAAINPFDDLDIEDVYDQFGTRMKDAFNRGYANNLIKFVSDEDRKELDRQLAEIEAKKNAANGAGVDLPGITTGTNASEIEKQGKNILAIEKALLNERETILREYNERKKALNDADEEAFKGSELGKKELLERLEKEKDKLLSELRQKQIDEDTRLRETQIQNALKYVDEVTRLEYEKAEAIKEVGLLTEEALKEAGIDRATAIRNIEKKYEAERTAALKRQEEMAKALAKSETIEKLKQQGRTQEEAEKYYEFENKSQTEKTTFAIGQAKTLFSALASQNKKFAAISKAIAIAEAIRNTYLGATKALASYPPPFNFIAAAATVASGLAQVATIRAQQYQRGGVATGGQPAIVGEDGPEIIVPKQSSTVIPREVADAIQGMGGRSQEVNVTFNIQANDTAGFDDLITSRRGLIVNLINTAMNERGRAGVTG
jgi:tape measure domain-containing protein